MIEKALEELKAKRQREKDSEKVASYEMYINALEKQIDKDVINFKRFESGLQRADCPTCGAVVIPPYNIKFEGVQYCQWCGQKMRWDRDEHN